MDCLVLERPCHCVMPCITATLRAGWSYMYLMVSCAEPHQIYKMMESLESDYIFCHYSTSVGEELQRAASLFFTAFTLWPATPGIPLVEELQNDQRALFTQGTTRCGYCKTNLMWLLRPLEVAYFNRYFDLSLISIGQIKTTQRYVWTKRESTEEGRPLGELVDQVSFIIHHIKILF